MLKVIRRHAPLSAALLSAPARCTCPHALLQETSAASDFEYTVVVDPAAAAKEASEAGGHRCLQMEEAAGSLGRASSCLGSESFFLRKVVLCHAATVL